MFTKSPLHFAVLQIWGLGDLIMTTPVLAEIRRLFPSSKITLIVRGGPQERLLCDSTMVDHILQMPARNFSLAMLKFFFSLRRHEIDVAFIGTRISPLLSFLLRGISGLKTVIGDYRRLGVGYTHARPIAVSEHRVDRMLNNLTMWTRQIPGPVTFYTASAELAKSEEIITDGGRWQQGRYLVVHPGSSVRDGTQKRIPLTLLESFVRSARKSLPRIGIAILLGPEEMDLLPYVKSLSPDAIPVTGLQLERIQDLIAGAACFIGSDSSMGHIAAAHRIPTVTLAGPTLPQESRPYGDLAVVITRKERLACQPCWGTPLYGKCPYSIRCMNEIAVPEVLQQVMRALQRYDSTGASRPTNTC